MKLCRGEHELPQATAVVRGRLPGHQFELFVEMGKVVETTFKTNLADALRIPGKQVAGPCDAVLVQEVREDLVVKFLEKPTKRRRGQVHMLGYLLLGELPLEIGLHELENAAHPLVVLRLHFSADLVDVQGQKILGSGQQLQYFQQLHQAAEAVHLRHFAQHFTDHPFGMAIKCHTGLCPLEKLLDGGKLRGVHKAIAQEVAPHLDDDFVMALIHLLGKAKVWDVGAQENQVALVVVADVVGNLSFAPAIGDEGDLVLWMAVPVG